MIVDNFLLNVDDRDLAEKKLSALFFKSGREIAKMSTNNQEKCQNWLNSQ